MAKKNWDDDIAAARRQEREAKRGKQMDCDHNTKEEVIKLSSYNSGSIQNRGWYPETCMICQHCGTIFNAETFDPKEVFNIFLNAQSLLQQIKFCTRANSNMDPEKLDSLNEMIAQLDNIRANVEPFYNDMVKALSKQDDKGGKKQKPRTGHIGINAGLYG